MGLAAIEDRALAFPKPGADLPEDDSMPTRVLFVCLGNICRSPLAQGILEQLASARNGASPPIHIDSAGTGAWHEGEPPDPRMRRVAAGNGVSLDQQRARQVRAADFEAFDHILAMDTENLEDLVRICPVAHRGKLALLRSYDPEGGADVPDPYYGGPDGFDRVFTIVERSCMGFLESLQGERAD